MKTKHDENTDNDDDTTLTIMTSRAVSTATKETNGFLYIRMEYMLMLTYFHFLRLYKKFQKKSKRITLTFQNMVLL